MQMRMSIWIFLLVVCTLSVACWAERAPANTSGRGNENIKIWLIRTSGIGEGQVELVKGPESCQEGTVRVLELEDEVTLMLGAHPLVIGIGKGTIEVAERECKTTDTASVSKQRIEADRQQTCNGVLTAYHVVVEPTENGLRYTRKVTSKGKVILFETCKYKYPNR